MKLDRMYVWMAMLGCMLLSAGLFARLPSLIPFRIGHQFGYCDTNLKLVIAPSYDDARPFGPMGAEVRKDGRAGFIDRAGRWIVPAAYDEVVAIGGALRIRQGARYALADSAGCLLSDFDYESVVDLRHGFYLTKRGDHKGILHVSGKVVVPNAYDHVYQMRDDQGNYVELFAMRAEGYLGLYNACGERVQQGRYERIDPFHEGFAIVQDGSGFGLVDLEGRLRVPCLFEQLLPMSEGLCAAKLKGRWGFIDGDGEELLGFLFDAVQENGFFQGRAAVSKAGDWVFVRRDGAVEFPLDDGFQCLGAMAEGLAPVCKLMEGGDVRYGYMDPEGRLRIPFKFERAESFRRGFAIVSGRVAKEASLITETRYGIIDRGGRMVIPLSLRTQTTARLKRDSLGHLGFASIDHNGRRCLVDGRGNRFGCEGLRMDVIQRAWMRTRCEHARLVAVSKGELWGFCDAQGRMVIPCQFASVQCFSDGLARVVPAGGGEEHSYYIDETGRPYYREP